jgi:hypothetical protein
MVSIFLLLALALIITITLVALKEHLTKELVKVTHDLLPDSADQ